MEASRRGQFAILPHRLVIDDQIPQRAKAMYGAIYSLINWTTLTGASPKLSKLAALAGVGKRQAINLLACLEAAGYLRIDRSAGRPSSYTLLPDCTGAKNCTGLDCTGAKNCTGLGDSDLTKCSEKRETEDPPSEGKKNTKPQNLYRDRLREKFISELGYYLGDDPALAAFRTWFPDAAFSVFDAHWDLNQDSHPSNAFNWAKKLAAIKATETEVAEAFAWAIATPQVDPQGKSEFSRPGFLRNIIARIESRRKKAQAKQHVNVHGD